MKKMSELRALAAATVGATECPFPMRVAGTTAIFIFPPQYFSCVSKFCRTLGQRTIVRKSVGGYYNVAVSIPAGNVPVWNAWPWATIVRECGWEKKWNFAPELLPRCAGANRQRFHRHEVKQ